MSDPVVLAVVAIVAIAAGFGIGFVTRSLWASQAIKAAQDKAGRIVAAGPGIPLPDPGSMEDEPWKTLESSSRHVPMQARVGDYAIFLRKASVEIKFEGRTYLIVPQGAILLLDRNPPERLPEEPEGEEE